MSKKATPELKIIKPTGFQEKFKSKRSPTIAGVGTLLTALPVLKIGDVNDFTRLHPNEDDYWTSELCFVLVPIPGDPKHSQLHLIDEEIAMNYLPSKKIKRHRLALASKPYDVIYLCIVPSQNLENSYNSTALKACERAKTQWLQVTSRKAEGVEAYKIDLARDPDAFPDPNWGVRSLDDLLEVTFRDALIETHDHPSLLRLIGARQNLT